MPPAGCHRSRHHKRFCSRRASRLSDGVVRHLGSKARKTPGGVRSAAWPPHTPGVETKGDTSTQRHTHTHTSPHRGRVGYIPCMHQGGQPEGSKHPTPLKTRRLLRTHVADGHLGIHGWGPFWTLLGYALSEQEHDSLPCLALAPWVETPDGRRQGCIAVRQHCLLASVLKRPSFFF
jgi:hypothetical protein